ncbi:SAM-dependent methyltransferase, partial [Leucobacter soli]|uniref:THUMP-like domain-containing protein n=1 Tax=Leucobacter soli TaxID=2812850 RepID=UPI00361E039C
LRSAGAAPDLVAAALTQAGLREKARAKFGERAASMLFTPAGLEQATRAAVADLHARRFAAAGCRRVIDLGCGIGTESLALQAAGIDVRPVEIDPFTAAIAAHNLGIEVTVGDAESVGIGDADGAFLDPARRTSGHRDTRRLSSPGDYSPSLDFAFGLADRLPTGVKLGPGFDRELIPDGAEAQWVSVDGQLVETGLWFGEVSRPGVRRAALVIRGDESHELTAAADAADVGARRLGEYVYEPDGAVIRARLIGRLAEDLGAGMVGNGIAYLTADEARPTPFAQAFRVREVLPAGEKALRRALAARGIGRLEIK